MKNNSDSSLISDLSAREVSALLEQTPFEVQLWNDLAKCTRVQNDLMSAQSIEAIANGLNELKQKTAQGGENQKSISKPSNFAASIFIRLARSYNNPHLLKQAGILFFSEWHLPSAALILFERSMRLGATEKEIVPLKEAASLAVEREGAQKHNSNRDYSGITSIEHVQPVIEDLLIKSGPLLVPWDLQRPAATSQSSPIVGKEDDAYLPESTVECIAQASLAAKDGKFRRAEFLLLKANNNPLRDEAMYEVWSTIGNAAFEANLYVEMQMAYRHAFNFNKTALASHFNLALANHLNKDFGQAELNYLSASRIAPNHPKIWCNLGVLYFQNRNYPKAEQSLRRAVSEDASYARAWDNLAAVLGSQNKLSAALDACSHAIQVRPEFPEAHFKIGIIYFGSQRLVDAANAFLHASRLPQLAPVAFTYLAMIYARLGEIDMAELFVKRAAKIDKHCEILWMALSDIGKAYYLTGNFVTAASIFEEVILLQADVPDAWFNLGLCSQALGELKKAQKFYQHAVDLDPGFHRAWHNLGILYAGQKNHRTASDAFRMELRERPKNALAWNDLAMSLKEEGLAREAEEAFARAESLAKGLNS